MGLRVLLGICLGLIALETVLGAPHSSRKEQDLRESFMEFIQQDKELAAVFQSGNLGPALSRSVRQAESGSEENEALPEQPPKDGFFDRAAKFVMEVLQRFLKWVNADN